MNQRTQPSGSFHNCKNLKKTQNSSIPPNSENKLKNLFLQNWTDPIQENLHNGNDHRKDEKSYKLLQKYRKEPLDSSFHESEKWIKEDSP